MNGGSEKLRKVLVIDDSESSRMLVRRHLQPEKVVIIEATDGRDGLEMARREHPDLVLLDLQLPGWDGFETIRRLKDDAQTCAIPVMFLSANSVTSAKVQGLDLGAVDFVSKPFDPIELRARVRAAMRAKSLQETLEERAYLDGLTGLANRLALSERLRSDWALCRRRQSPLALLIADLDRFKTINDRYGHPVGDRILQGTALTLRDAVRSGDFVARYGGEEFVVVAPDCDLEGIAAVGERFRQAVATMHGTNHPLDIPTTTSVGVSHATSFEGEPEDLLRLADGALYHAKAAGRNMVWASDRGVLRPASAVLGSGDASSRRAGVTIGD